ncbi:unnamed protein product [Mycena citricolor]|uniref:DUF6534 domain-containing protein n=1 Tax=Mycena citricolor TaxID=2018698 RepID=A0AAD2H7B6_9AGAR|nr:unnamed protein product [Mycena citricolor]
MNAETSFKDTCNAIRRLTIASLRNGAITTVLIAVVIFCIQPETNTATMIEIIVGRIYSLSMLSNPNNRASLLGDTSLHGNKTSEANIGINPHGIDGNYTGGVPMVLRIRHDVETHYQRDAIPMEARGKEGGGLESNEDGIVIEYKFQEGTVYNHPF